MHGSEANGNFRIYQGGCATATVMRGAIVHGKLRLTGSEVSDATGRIEIAGTIQKNSLQGILTIEKAAEPKTLRLKRIAHSHCQN